MTLKKHMLVCGLLVASMFNAAADGFADRIILKDGSVETSDRIWESERYIHFILKGTREVEIRYAKEIVARIERQEPAGGPVRQNSQPHIEKSPADAGVCEPDAHHRLPVHGQKPGIIRNQPLDAHQQVIEKNRGLSFYDPRRPMRYWALPGSRHKELGSALDALARHYDRSTQWVETHMGLENDLGKIHQNLARQFQNETLGAGRSGLLKNNKIKQLNLSKGTVEKKPGELEANRQPLPMPPQVRSGIRFYDPRRVKKYWSDQKTRHHTLKAALNALAQQYGVTPSWIETHMGDTNDLAVIHGNIQRNLKQR